MGPRTASLGLLSVVQGILELASWCQDAGRGIVMFNDRDFQGCVIATYVVAVALLVIVFCIGVAVGRAWR